MDKKSCNKKYVLFLIKKKYKLVDSDKSSFYFCNYLLSQYLLFTFSNAYDAIVKIHRI